MHKRLFIILSMCVLCVWTGVLVYALPIKGEHMAYTQPYLKHLAPSNKEHMQWKQPLADQSVNQKKASAIDYSNPLDNLILPLSSDGTVSVDVLLKALEEKDS